MTHQRKVLGKWGEEKAKEYLLNQGYILIAQNWRTRYGELDLIMLDQETVVFVEVRTKSTSDFGKASESIHHRKQQKLLYTAEAFLTSKKWWNRNVRFDLISIDKIEGKYQIQHIKNIIH
ncbi:YraN family protein [Tepidibacillus sp. LV47]|uniref:YraN family protein n=1 Tax=Tepidibacillus sp. LV47 TaxID=3398228 RepID=UPI003AAB7454